MRFAQEGRDTIGPLTQRPDHRLAFVRQPGRHDAAGAALEQVFPAAGICGKSFPNLRENRCEYAFFHQHLASGRNFLFFRLPRRMHDGRRHDGGFP